MASQISDEQIAGVLAFLDSVEVPRKTLLCNIAFLEITNKRLWLMTHDLRCWVAKAVRAQCNFEDAYNNGVPSANPDAVLDRMWGDAYCTLNPPPELSEFDRAEILRMARQ